MNFIFCKLTVLFFKWIVLFRDGVYINQSTFCDKMENDCDNIWTLSLDQHRQSKYFQDQFDCVELRNENHIAIFSLLTNVGLIENDIICGLIFNTQNVDSLLYTFWLNHGDVTKFYFSNLNLNGQCDKTFNCICTNHQPPSQYFPRKCLMMMENCWFFTKLQKAFWPILSRQSHEMDCSL